MRMYKVKAERKASRGMTPVRIRWRFPEVRRTVRTVGRRNRVRESRVRESRVRGEKKRVRVIEMKTRR